MTTCQSCGKAVSEEASFCSNCGAAVDEHGISGTGTEAVTERAERILETSTDTAGSGAAETGTTGTAVTAGNVDVVSRRVGAKIIDWIVLGVIYIPSAAVLGGLLSGGRPPGPTPGRIFLLLGLPIVLNFLYHTITEAKWGQTVGKRLLGIVVLKEDGRTITYGDAVIRNLLRYIDAIFYYLVGIIVIAVSSEKQRLGDVLADTVVVRTESQA